MNAMILCVGKAREKFYAQACEEYLKRLSRFGKYSVVEVPDAPEPTHDTPAANERVLSQEGQKLLAHIKNDDHVIAMAIDGPQYASPVFAKHLQTVASDKRIVFVIGGSLGLWQPVLARANEKISLSKMTFPHQLARVLLLEQLFRAEKILAGERYHK